MEDTTITQPVQADQVITTDIPSIIPQENTNNVPVKDLITKVSDFKKSKSVNPVVDNQQSFFDYKEIEKIADPMARKFAEDAFKSMQSAFTKKTQEVAYERSGYEHKLKEMENWSPERIQRELRNPQFVQAAQMYAQVQNPPNSGLTEEQFSALTPQEKAELAQVPGLKNEINQLKQVNYQAIVAQRDSQLQTRYPDYNPSQIDLTISNLAQMNPLDIREHVYKSLKHDEDVAAAYELGLKEARGLNQEKINAIAPSGNFVTNSNGKPVREKGDTDQMFFMKLANYNLAQSKNNRK